MLIGKNTTIFEDPSGELTLTDILQDEYQNKFTSQDKDVFNRPATKSAFWFKMTIQNSCDEDAWLEVGSTYAWYIDFYAPNDSNQYQEAILTGTMRPDSNKLYDINLFWFPLNKAFDNTPKTYYFKIQSGLTYELPLSVGTVRSLSKNKDIFDFITAGFIGIMAIMLLYNTFIYFSTKDHLYTYYLGYLLMMLVSMPYANGYPFVEHIQIGFIDKEWWNSFFLFWHPITYFFVGVFCIKYLDLAKNAKLIQRIIWVEIGVLSILFPLLTLLGFKFVELVNYIQPLILIFYLTCLISGYYVAAKKVQQAYFFIFGWTFLVLSAVIFFAVINGFIPYNPYTRNVLYYGATIEVWMFSLALGNRLNILQKEKERIQSENITLVNHQNEILERKVNERTFALEIKNKELAKNNNELRILSDKLDTQSQQLKELNITKDQLFAIIGHDLKSPIITLSNLIEMADKEILTKDNISQIFGKLKKNVEYLHFTLNNLLQWAINQMQGVKIKKEPFHIQPLFEEIRKLLIEYANNKNIRISNCSKKDIQVYADPDSFKLIVRNLLNNSIKFTNPGGVVSIKATVEDDNCEIAISDNGVGIPNEQLQNLWKQHSLKSVYGTDGEKGTGIGLWLCQEFVEKNGGHIWAESKEKQGTTFFFSLPLAKKN